MSVLPPELVIEAVLASLHPPSPALSSASSSASSSLVSTPTLVGSAGSIASSDKADPFAAAFGAHSALSKAAVLRSYSLVNRSLRSVSQPLLFRDPVLPTLRSILAFLNVLEDGDNGARLAHEVRSLTLGSKFEDGALGGGRGCVDAKLVMRRLARVCTEVREVTMLGMGRVRLEELDGMHRLRKLTIDSCLLAPSTSYEPGFALPSITHFSLLECHLTTHSLPPTLLPSLTAFQLVMPRGALASSPGQIADFLTGVAPQLRAFSLNDQTSDNANGAHIEFNPLSDAYSHFTDSLTHLDLVNTVPLVPLSLLALPTLRSLHTLSLSLASHLAAGASRATPRWGPLADSHLREVLRVVRVLVLPPELLYLLEDRAAGAHLALPRWITELQRSEELERVVLPARAFEDGLGEMVAIVQDELRRAGRDVRLVSHPYPVDEDGQDGEGKAPVEGVAFWRAVAEREKEERQARRRAENASW
ncbi:uncharacterized protein JCM10292_000992 [Rhodotorula paludigena]|uniref:uncharacterized protein n=1 Tax=Rhodotorula paludigena TaxID=86838 RepID=UPI00316CFCEA